MKFSSKTYSILAQYDIDVHSGFLPKEPPLDRLPKEYDEWENLNDKMTVALQEGSFIREVEALRLLDIGKLSKRESERAMMLLGAFAHAFITESKSNVLPSQIAIPWVKMAERLKRLPVITHSNLVLQNWKLIEPIKGFQLSNLDTQFSFTGTDTESWFFLSTTNVERVGARAIPLLLECVLFAQQEDYEKATLMMKKVLPILEELLHALRKMYEGCIPEVFYNQVRRFFDSFENVMYKGVRNEMRSYMGGSAAQSSLLQFLDMVMGIDYGHSHARHFLVEMRHYMPYPHREFLQFVQEEFNLKAARSKSQSFNEICSEIVGCLIEFRNEHLKMVSQYIIRPARKENKSTKGTGGTNPLVFLKSVRNKNIEHHEAADL